MTVPYEMLVTKEQIQDNKQNDGCQELEAGDTGDNSILAVEFHIE